MRRPLRATSSNRRVRSRVLLRERTVTASSPAAKRPACERALPNWRLTVRRPLVSQALLGLLDTRLASHFVPEVLPEPAPARAAKGARAACPSPSLFFEWDDVVDERPALRGTRSLIVVVGHHVKVGRDRGAHRNSQVPRCTWLFRALTPRQVTQREPRGSRRAGLTFVGCLALRHPTPPLRLASARARRRRPGRRLHLFFSLRLSPQVVLLYRRRGSATCSDGLGQVGVRGRALSWRACQRATPSR
jgi:hypothetical protein